MHVIGNILVINFKKGPQKDLAVCLGLVKEMLSLSLSFKTVLFLKGKVGKKFNKTVRIRNKIHSFVDRTTMSADGVDELISLIRRGVLSEVTTYFDGQEVVITHETDVAKLLTDLLIKRQAS